MIKMNKSSVLEALKRGDTVCHGSSRWHVGVGTHVNKYELYKFDVFTGTTAIIKDFSMCFVHVGGVGSDDL